MRIDAPIITGSFSLNGSTLQNLSALSTTGSNTFVGNQNVQGYISASALTGSIDFTNLTNSPTLVSGSSQVINILSSLNTATASFTPRITNLESKSASVDISISNINSVTASNLARLSNLETKSASVDISITNINSVTASNIARLNNLETKSASVDVSITNINSFTASNNITSLNSKTGSYATTGSNTFFGTQTYSGSVYIANDLVVQGSSSIQYISASSVSIGTNIVQLNTANPSVRFAGLTMIDSGSVGGSGSFLYDSLQDEFIFVHRGNGTNVTSSHFVTGPETYDSLGNETYLTCNRLTKGTGKEHLVDSCIYHDNNTTCIYNGALVINSNCQFMFGIAPADFAFNVGTTCVGTNASIAQFFNNDYTSTTRGFIRVRNSATISSTTSAYFGQGQDQKTYFYNNDTSRLGDIVITNTGKVGIGTASPIAQLHIKTDVASESRPTTLATSATNSAAYITTICGSNAGIAFGQLGANSNYIQSTYENGSACTPLLLNPYGGNVGIGTGNTAPGGALDVVTCSNSTQNFYLRNTNNLDGSSRSYFNIVAGNTSLSLLALAGGGSCGGTYIAGTTGADMYFQQSPSGNNNIVIKANGYVGINITSACKQLEVGGTIRTTVSPSAYYRDMSYIGDTYQFGSGETSDNVDFRICGGSTWSTGGNFRWFTQAGNTTPSERLRITAGGSVGIAATNPRTQLDVGDIHDGVGGTTFCAFLVAQGTWATFACVTNGDTNVITDITYVNNNDYNRSGAILARWAYHSPTAALYITDCAYNWQQNINQFGLRNNGGALQICLGGGANGYRVQARVQGARATG